MKIIKIVLAAIILSPLLLIAKALDWVFGDEEPYQTPKHPHIH